MSSNVQRNYCICVSHPCRCGAMIPGGRAPEVAPDSPIPDKPNKVATIGCSCGKFYANVLYTNVVKDGRLVYSDIDRQMTLAMETPKVIKLNKVHRSRCNEPMQIGDARDLSEAEFNSFPFTDEQKAKLATLQQEAKDLMALYKNTEPSSSGWRCESGAIAESIPEAIPTIFLPKPEDPAVFPVETWAEDPDDPTHLILLREPLHKE